MAELTVAALPAAAGLVPLPVVASAEQAARAGYALVLDYFPEGLGLARPAGRERPLVVDFTGGRQGWRTAHDRVRHELVVKACLSGTEHARPPVVDATAGLGRDAFLLACAGAQVTLVEQHPVLAAMLRDGIQRLARAEPSLSDRLGLVEGSAEEVLTEIAVVPEAVLLDPMFPARQKSAAVKKELAFLQQLEQPPDAAEEEALLASARGTGARRVVVKRPLRAPALAGAAPSFQLSGKAVRFDVYARP